MEIPVIKLGYGNPKITILTGLHGDEYSGLLILKELLNKIEVKKGTLQLIVCANPLARVTKTRETFTDFMDLNRAFPGDEKGSMTQKIAHKLLQNLGVSTDKLDKMIEAAKVAGAYGAKLSGAGGGDCMIALVSEDTKEKVEKAIKKVSGEIIKVKNNTEGVRTEK